MFRDVDQGVYCWVGEWRGCCGRGGCSVAGWEEGAFEFLKDFPRFNHFVEEIIVALWIREEGFALGDRERETG